MRTTGNLLVHGGFVAMNIQTYIRGR
jgi:hypothetical protein